MLKSSSEVYTSAKTVTKGEKNTVSHRALLSSAPSIIKAEVKGCIDGGLAVGIIERCKRPSGQMSVTPLLQTQLRQWVWRCASEKTLLTLEEPWIKIRVCTCPDYTTIKQHCRDEHSESGQSKQHGWTPQYNEAETAANSAELAATQNKLLLHPLSLFGYAEWAWAQSHLLHPSPFHSLSLSFIHPSLSKSHFLTRLSIAIMHTNQYTHLSHALMTTCVSAFPSINTTACHFCS